MTTESILNRARELAEFGLPVRIAMRAARRGITGPNEAAAAMHATRRLRIGATQVLDHSVLATYWRGTERDSPIICEQRLGRSAVLRAFDAALHA